MYMRISRIIFLRLKRFLLIYTLCYFVNKYVTRQYIRNRLGYDLNMNDGFLFF